MRSPAAPAPAPGGGPTAARLLLAGCPEGATEPVQLADKLERLGLVARGSERVANGLPDFISLGAHDFGLSAGAAAQAIAADVIGEATSRLGAVEAATAEQCALALALDHVPGTRTAAAQAMAAAAALIAGALGARAMFWSPAQLWSPTAMLGEAAVAMQRQGLPPVLHVVAFAVHRFAATLVIDTRGLAWFGGWELRLICPHHYNPAEGLRRAGRLAIAMMVEGPGGGLNSVSDMADGWASATVPGLLPGERLTIGALLSEGERTILPVTLTPGAR